MKPKLIDTTKLEDNYIEIKDKDFGTLRVDKNLIEFMGEKSQNKPDSYKWIIMDLNEEQNEQ